MSKRRILLVVVAALIVLVAGFLIIDNMAEAAIITTDIDETTTAISAEGAHHEMAPRIDMATLAEKAWIATMIEKTAINSADINSALAAPVIVMTTSADARAAPTFNLYDTDTTAYTSQTTGDCQDRFRG